MIKIWMTVIILFIVGSSTTAFTEYAYSQTTVITSPYATTISTNTQIVQNNNDLVCVDLTYDLFQGLSDRTNDKSVTKLQIFLYKSGYLKVNPNGNFGPSTYNAVKNYQSANNISSTGRVGPLTRRLIKDNSCIVRSNTASVINSQTTPASTPISASRISSDKLTIVTPYAGEYLKTDSKVRVRWKDMKDANYSLILEDKDGLSFGYVTSSVFGNTYDWTIGKVYSARSNSEIYVPPGQYRIYAKNNGLSKNAPEQFSGLFSILGKPLEIDSVLPNVISNSADTSVVLYGRGFDDSTVVNFDVSNNGRIAKPNFVSSDGRILVFKISPLVRIGQYGITVNNTYDGGATSTPSNAVNLTIKE
jgi:peptidoglycan hydrolase-like protein with peptidoglycan-binding domain